MNTRNSEPTLELNLSLEAPPDPVAFTPDDPDYAFDPAFTGRELLDWWRQNIGAIQQGLNAENALRQLHSFCRRSPRELEAMIRHVAKDRDARKWWGIGRSPATWLRTKDTESGEQQWQVIRAHWLAAGGKLPRTEPTPAEVAARSAYQPIPAPPPWDPTCPGLGRGCHRGHVRDANNTRVPCPECELGEWMRDYNTRPEVLAAMDLNACGVPPRQLVMEAA